MPNCGSGLVNMQMFYFDTINFLKKKGHDPKRSTTVIYLND